MSQDLPEFVIVRLGSENMGIHRTILSFVTCYKLTIITSLKESHFTKD